MPNKRRPIFRMIYRTIALAAALLAAPLHAGPVIIVRPVIIPRPMAMPRPVAARRPVVATRTAPAFRPVTRQTASAPVHSSWSWLPFWVGMNAANQREQFARDCRKVPPARRSPECIRAIGRK